MEEEISNVDDYVDWLKWLSDAEIRRHAMFESSNCEKNPTLLQIHETKGGDVHNNSNNKLTTSDNNEVSTRWKEICQKIQVDPNLDKEKEQQLWKVLECYQDVFAWNKGELGCCTIREHVVDTHGFPPCKVSLGQLSWRRQK
jgi:hypothetical protein